MSSANQPGSSPEAQRLYRQAQLYSLLGMRQRASELSRSALQLGDHALARKLLARLELPGDEYFEVLRRMHRYLKPKNYVEIGIWKGKSLRLAAPDTRVLGIDPAPRLKRPAGAHMQIFSETSDDFFSNHQLSELLGGEALELALIDGMHKFEYALRDFINLERYSKPGTIILFHDCYPVDEPSAERERKTLFWSGDIWRVILLLKKYRPDLSVHTILTPPSGLGMVLNPNSRSTVLSERLEQIVAEGFAMTYAALAAGKAELLNGCPNKWSKIRELLDARREAWRR
jgi:Methyltransferase domain